MKIVILSPPWIPLPPKGYGGIERIVYYLSEGLKRKGHNIIVYATGDSRISSELGFFHEKSLGIDTILEHGHGLLFLNHIHHAIKTLPKDADIIHSHCEYYAMHLLDQVKYPIVHTLHGSFSIDPKKDPKDNKSILAYLETLNLFKSHNFVSISNYQRNGNPTLNFAGTVYNSINIEEFYFYEESLDYMSWLGRYSPIKGLDVAIELAKKMQKKLMLSVSIHKQRQENFDKNILPLIDNKSIVLDEIEEHPSKKSKFLGESRVFLFPIQWEEPFGLVMIEAMATGTPVVAIARGSAPEIIKDGETGFLVNPFDNDIRGNFIVKKTGIEGLCEAIERIYQMSDDKYRKMRRAARLHVEKNFTVEKMVDGYEKVYQKIL